MSSRAQRCWAVVPAAGIGSRMASDVPKQYMPLVGLTVLEHTLGSLLGCADIESLMVALHVDDQRAEALSCFEDPRVKHTVGGNTRSASVLAALKALDDLADAQDWVLVHDAARPCVMSSEIARLIREVRTSGTGGILALPISDTVKRSTGNPEVEQTLDRRHLWRAQTPQMFRLGLLRSALEEALASGRDITDEASAMEAAGHTVALHVGSARNLKITRPEDLLLAEFYLHQGRTAP